MTIQELFIDSNLALLAVVDQIRDDQWGLQMPSETTKNSAPTTLRDAVAYHAFDDACVPDVLQGDMTADEVTSVYQYILTADDVKNEYHVNNQRAIDAVGALLENDLALMVHLSYGDFPIRQYLQHITAFRAFRSYDIAKMIGADTTMDAEFVQGLLDEYVPVIEQYRQMGVFPPAVAVPDNADPQTKLLGMVGRS